MRFQKLSERLIHFAVDIPEPSLQSKLNSAMNVYRPNAYVVHNGDYFSYFLLSSPHFCYNAVFI